jgi:hypothetical protein
MIKTKYVSRICNRIMRLKSELYKKEQEELCDKIIEILDLSETNTITLYELDKENKGKNHFFIINKN